MPIADQPWLRRLGADGRPLIPLNDEQQRHLTMLRKKIGNQYALKSVGCLCGSASERWSWVAGKDRYGLSLNVYLCADCGLLWINPRLDGDATAKFYRDDYRGVYRGDAQGSEAFYRMQATNAERIVEFLHDAVPGLSAGKVFDIGCGAGGGLEPFRQSGWTVAGCDYGEEYIKLGLCKGLDLVPGGAETLQSRAPADLVFARHVLEHTLDPIQELSTWAGLLADGGYLYVEVPGILDEFLTNKEVGRYFHIAHTYHFTRTTLQWAAAQAGLKLIKGNEGVAALFQKCSAAPIPDREALALNARAVMTQIGRAASPFFRTVWRPLFKMHRSIKRRI